MKKYVLLLRPQQWFKNIFIFAGLLFSKQFLDASSLLTSVGTFIIFCILSSGIYIINDILDYEDDRVHPLKSQRPIAACQVTRTSALLIALVLLAIALLGSYLVGIHLFFICLIYSVMMILYSVAIKHVMILDVLFVAIGYVLRAIAGAVAIDVIISSWLLLCSLLLALLIVIAKRRNELEMLGAHADQHRRTLAHYPVAFLNQLIAIVTAACIVSYCMYTLAPETVAKFQTRNLIFTIPFVLYGIFRYLYLTYTNKTQGPERLFLRDIPLQICLVLWTIACIVIIAVD